jgi:hypothetical protein
MKKICAVTMARNDEFFLSRWIKYYGRQFGEENLFVFLDGEDQTAPKNAEKTNIEICQRTEGKVVRQDKRRIQILTKAAEKLLESYDIVIGTDSDEFLVLDPDCRENLSEYLSKINIKISVSGLGIDVGQNLTQENKLDINLPFFEQRSFAVLSSRYTKTVVMAKKARWGSGFHRIKGHNFHIDKNLYLFHFGSADYETLKQKMHDSEKIKGGWKRHLRKRARTIHYVTGKKARNWEITVNFARILQTVFRPIYALNKPSMLGMKLVVKVPQKFKNIL